MNHSKDNLHHFNNLIIKIAGGDKKALHTFYNKYCKMIYYTAKIICLKHEDAEEVVNTVLIKVWNNAETLDYIKNPEGWIYTVTINAAKDKIKRRQEWFPLIDDILCDSAESEVLSDDYFYYLIKDLTEIEQTVILHKIMEDLTLTKIAELMNKQVSSIKQIYKRALKKINKKIISENM